MPITPINTFTKSFSLAVAQTSGIQAFTSYYNEAGTLVTGAYLLLASPSEQFALEIPTSISLTMERKSEIQI